MGNKSDYAILICDDDSIALNSIHLLLKAKGYTVLSCINGREAVEIIKNKKIHILILDYYMPEFSGEDVINEVRKFDHELFIIINTGFADDIPPIETMERLRIQGYHSKGDHFIKLMQWICAGITFCEQIEEVKELYKRSTTDGLTGLYNRSHLFELIEREMLAAKRYNRKLSVLMTDIDYFKKVNDTYGHEVGDMVLKSVSKALAASIRQNIEFAGRYGGEEFAVVLPETDLEQAKTVAERLRYTIENLQAIESYPDLHITISIGIAEMQEEDSVEKMFKRADEMLYKAKGNGRNRVEA